MPLNTTNFVPEGADFSANRIAILPAIASDLLYFGLYGSAADMARNFAIGGAAPTVVGTPSISGGLATFTGYSDYIETNIATPAEGLTVFAVAAKPADDHGFILGNVNAAGDFWMYFNERTAADGNVRLDAQLATDVAGSRNASGIFGPSEPVFTAPKCVFFRYSSSTGVRNLRDLTNGANLAVNTLTDKTIWMEEATQNLRIGSPNTSGFAGSVDLAALMIYRGYMSDADYATQYAWLQSYLSAYSGLTI